MIELNADYLNRLLERHPEGEIHTTVLDLKACLVDLEQEKDPEKEVTLTETVRDLATLLERELYEDHRGGEDYINDGVFHAME